MSQLILLKNLFYQVALPLKSLDKFFVLKRYFRLSINNIVVLNIEIIPNKENGIIPWLDRKAVENPMILLFKGKNIFPLNADFENI